MTLPQTARQTTRPEVAVCRTPSPPSVYLNTTYASPAGRTIKVAGGDAGRLQKALDEARPGDAIELEAGATYTGNFTLPAKSGEGLVTIRSSAEASLPRGKRVTPAAAARLPKIITPNAAAAIKTEPRAHHYRLAGLEIGVAPGVKHNQGIVLLGDGSREQNSLDKVPHDLVIDRCYIHGNGKGDVSRGVALNSARSAVIDSFIAACHGVGFDTQAIAGWNGPGPFKIVNNYLEGAGENVLFGGADPAIRDLVPSDIEFRGNHCAKPLSWKKNDPNYAGSPWSVKNLFELKNARRVLVEGNLFEHNWVDAQSGFAILFTVRNQDGGSPWSVVEDVIFTGNVVRRAAAGINILGFDDNHPSQQVKRIHIRNNLFDVIGGSQWGVNGRFLQLTEAACIIVDHNTIFHTGSVIVTYGKPSANFVFTNNVAAHNEYGVFGGDVGSGAAALERYFPGCEFKKNLLAGGRAAIYPPDNFFTPLNCKSSSDCPPGSASSAFGKAGTDGKPIGCDLSALRAMAERVQELQP